MPNLPQPNKSGIPPYSVPFLNEDGKTVSERWYRFLRNTGENAQGAVQLFQGPLADRPDAAEFHDGTVLFIDTDESRMYYVESPAWVKLMNFIGYNGGTQKVTVPADFEALGSVTVGADLAVTGNETVADITASGNISAVDVAASGALSGDTVASTSTITAGTDITATGNIDGVDITASGVLAGDSVSSTTTVDAGTDVTAGGDVVATGNISGVDITASGILTGNSISSTTTIAAGTTISAGTTITATTGLFSLASTITATFFQSGASTGETHTVPLAKLTGGGANGSVTFTGGIETGHVDPT